MIKTVIIDDEPLARSIVNEYLSSYPDVKIMQECNDGFEGVKAVAQHKPDLIFLDEPTTGLDPQARIEVWQTVKALAEGGTTVLLTTQYLDEAEQLADRIAILHKGTIIQNGTLAELKQLLPPAEVEYVEKQPSLEDVFLALVGNHAGKEPR